MSMQSSFPEIDPQTVERIGPGAIKPGHILKIRPFQGRTKIICLTRTRYEFHSSVAGKMNQSDIVFELQSTEFENFHVEMLLCLPEGKDEHNDHSVYYIRSLGRRPFRLNGVWTREAWPQMGDRLDLGHNLLIFGVNQDQKEIKEEVDEEEVVDLLANKSFLKSDLSLLIEGETGTGKTRLARLIHEKSEKVGQFIHVNLAAFAPGLIESELFGHVKGAYTGAISSKMGALLESARGTLFLDEIDSLSLEMQAKILLFLDSKTVRAVGGHEEKKIETRIIAASGKPLRVLVEEGKMRPDFYFRLSSGAKIVLRPLRDRPESIAALIREFEKTNHVFISKALEEYYLKCLWPGNIRQFLGHLEKKKILGQTNRLDLDSFDEQLNGQEVVVLGKDLGQYPTLEDVKKSYVKKILRLCHGKAIDAAKVLDITSSTVRILSRP